MKKSDNESAGEQSRQGQLRLPLREFVRETLFDTVMVSGLEFVGEVLEEERTALCGPRLSARSGPNPLKLTVLGCGDQSEIDGSFRN